MHFSTFFTLGPNILENSFKLWPHIYLNIHLLRFNFLHIYYFYSTTDIPTTTFANLQIFQFQPVQQTSGEALYLGCCCRCCLFVYNSVERHRSNPVLAVKCSHFVKIKFLRSIFFETPCKILAMGF